MEMIGVVVLGASEEEEDWEVSSIVSSKRRYGNGGSLWERNLGSMVV